MTWEVSNSELRSFQRCRRQWALTYHWGFATRPESVSPVTVAALGSRVHLALEAHHGHGLDPLTVLRWSYARLVEERPEFEVDLVKERDYALFMVEGYLQWVGEEGIEAGYDVVDVEHELRVPVETRAGEVILRGKLDQLVRRMNDGALLLRDFKTVGSLEKANTLVLDQQMRHYALLLSLRHRDDGMRVDGALYTMLKRSKRTTRASPPFYAQVEITYNRHDLNATYQRVTAVAATIVSTHDFLDGGASHHEVAYPNPTDYCSWGCPFTVVCPLMDDGSRWEDALTANYVQEDPYAYYQRDPIEEFVATLGAATTQEERK